MTFATWILTYGDTLRKAVFLFLFLGLILLEWWIPYRTQSLHKKKRWPANLILTVFNFVMLVSLPITLVSIAFWTEQQKWGLLPLLPLPFFLWVLSQLLIRGFISFITHLLLHKTPLLWRIHRVHHLDTELDVTTTVRVHPLEFLFNIVVGGVLVIAFGLSPWLLIFYEVLNVVVNLFSHANLQLPSWLEKGLRYLLVTPDLHRVHHSSFQPETDSNFGAVFPIWDLIFGTYRTKSKGEQKTMQLGLAKARDAKVNSALWLLYSPLQNGINDDEISDKALLQAGRLLLVTQ